MSEWMFDFECSQDHEPFENGYCQGKPASQYFPPQAQKCMLSTSPLEMLLSPPMSRFDSYSPIIQYPPAPYLTPPAQYQQIPTQNPTHYSRTIVYDNYDIPRGDNPRETRNKAEKQRRDKLNYSISQLATLVPPVIASNRKIDKTGILRLTAHFLRSHQYVFGDSIDRDPQEFSPESTLALLGLLKGFLLTTTYKGIVVVVSPNVSEFLGYSALDLLGQNILKIIHEEDHAILKEQLQPRSNLLGNFGELLIPDDPEGKQKVIDCLANETRKFVLRFKKQSHSRSPAQYVTCCVEGNLRKSDRACRGYNRCYQTVRRARARADNPYSSGNDVVFVGIVRPSKETFLTERIIESFRMEYRTRHSVDGEIMECEQRLSLVTGYMLHEVHGVNAMNFMHRDDVRWVVFALRDMYSQRRLFGESCYRLMTKNGQFIYMRTRGQLDVNGDSRAVTSFVCVNTVVAEEEGKYLIRLMKKKLEPILKNEYQLCEPARDVAVRNELPVPIEDPQQLEKVILHLVTNISPPKSNNVLKTTDGGVCNLKIIPPNKERIKSAIEKIYKVVRWIKSDYVMSSDKVSEITVAEVPTADAPTGDAPTGDAPTGDAPTGAAPTGAAPTGDAPTGDAPTADSIATISTQTMPVSSATSETSDNAQLGSSDQMKNPTQSDGSSLIEGSSLSDSKGSNKERPTETQEPVLESLNSPIPSTSSGSGAKRRRDGQTQTPHAKKRASEETKDKQLVSPILQQFIQESILTNPVSSLVTLEPVPEILHSEEIERLLAIEAELREKAAEEERKKNKSNGNDSDSLDD